MNTPSRVFKLEFANAEEFRREHGANLVNGGVFVATDEPATPREAVAVELSLAEHSTKVQLDGEIVHIVPPQLEEAGAVPGVAIQFSCTQTALRAALEPLVRVTGAARPEPPDSGRRKAPRMPAQVPIRIRAPDVSLSGYTRDISLCGVLVSVPGDSMTVGTRVHLTIDHPSNGESLDVEATVTRQVASRGGTVAIAIEFDPPPEQQDDVHRFVADLQSAEHSRRLGGMHGSLTEINPSNLLGMLGKIAPSGTLTITNDNEQAIIGFEGAMLRYVQMGRIGGVKALTRVLGWEEGSFEFHARLESVLSEDDPMPFDAALLRATRDLDELRALDLSLLPPNAKVRFQSAPSGPGGAQLSKVECAVLDLARGEFTVRRIVDMIPEPDAEILRALTFLADLGSIAIERR